MCSILRLWLNFGQRERFTPKCSKYMHKICAPTVHLAKISFFGCLNFSFKLWQNVKYFCQKSAIFRRKCAKISAPLYSSVIVKYSTPYLVDVHWRPLDGALRCLNSFQFFSYATLGQVFLVVGCFPPLETIQLALRKKVRQCVVLNYDLFNIPY